MKALAKWRIHHSLTMHALVPIWAKVPDKARWHIVSWLNRSKRFSWCILVDAAQSPTDGDDPCDGHLPTPGTAGCRGRCGWFHEHADRAACTCYCGKFRVEAPSATEVA